MNTQRQRPERRAFLMKLEAIRSAGKKFLVTRETATLLPGLPAFARMIDAAIELHNAIDPEERGSLGYTSLLWTIAAGADHRRRRDHVLESTFSRLKPRRD